MTIPAVAGCFYGFFLNLVKLKIIFLDSIFPSSVLIFHHDYPNRQYF